MRSLTNLYDKLYGVYGPQGWWPGRTRFEIIVGAILTQNTAWANVEKAIANLKRERLLTPARMRSVKVGKLAAVIKPAGYYNVKAKRLKNFLKFLFDSYNGSLDRLSRVATSKLRNKMLAVNGIGPETCDSILLYAFGRPVFVVDAYTKRIFARHGYFDERSDYHTVQEYFMDNLPKDGKLYNEYHALIVRLGKELCRTKPRCKLCPIESV